MKAINLLRLFLQSLSYRSSYYVNKRHNQLTKSICQIPLKELPWAHRFHDHTSLRSPKGTHCLKVHEISWCIYWEYLFLLVSINNEKSIGNIWSAYDLAHRSKSLLIAMQAQYSLKVETQHIEATWRSHDYMITLCHNSS